MPRLRRQFRQKVAPEKHAPVYGKVSAKDLPRAAIRVIELLRRNPSLNGEVALSYLLWPNGVPRLEVIERAVEHYLDVRRVA